ncbi:MAG: pilus assembly protein [Brevundimonas sp.]|nr:MAG: pilus assembly protein [Brevundimonas sp.]
MGLLTRLGRDRRGVSAVEFALLAPVMIAFYFGMAEFCQGYMAQKRMGHVAATVADLVAQSSTLSGSNVDDFFTVGALVMKPFSASPLKQRVSNITVNSSGVAKVIWSRGTGLTARPTGSNVTLPTGLLANGESVIMAEATYDYDSPVDYLMPSITKFSHSYYLRPRNVETVAYTN